MSAEKSSGKKKKKSIISVSRPNFQNTDLHVEIDGFKAVGKPLNLRIAPLTIISGTNSAGKSSFMQPLLVMKQTLEASFDPGALLLHGPNAKFTAISQTLSREKSRRTQRKSFTVKLSSGQHGRKLTYKQTNQGYVIDSDCTFNGDTEIPVTENMSETAIESLKKHLNEYGSYFLAEWIKSAKDRKLDNIDQPHLTVRRQRCFLDVSLVLGNERGVRVDFGGSAIDTQTEAWTSLIRGIIHVPGLRGNPEREYPHSAVGRTYPGTFEGYVASIILQWAQKDPGKIESLGHELDRLGLTWKVSARKVNDAAVELLMGRMPRAQQGGAQDMVSVADVGFGVSQTLPVVVALLVASRGQVVYLEQPEIHLHPRAQVQLAKTLVDASKRGVKVVVETHSALLIRAIQTEIALKNISPKSVSMNWFSRDEITGFAKLDVADLDDKGRFGDWPLDFDDIAQDADLAYIEAIHGV